MWSKLSGNILASIQKQGLSFLILAAAVYWFSIKYDQLQEKIDLCNNNVIEIYQEQNQQFIEAINKLESLKCN